jgi:hypothetical protein
MSTEERRQQNRQKQKRWQAKHHDTLWMRRQHKKLLGFELDHRHLRAEFRTFELADPRDAPDLMPRLIGYCRVEQRPVWAALWALKEISNAKWAVWFRELAAAGVEPVELSGWALGVAMPIKLRLAKSLVAMRVEQVCRLVSGKPRTTPPWLCNQMRVGGKRPGRRVGRIMPDGTVERFASLHEASRVAGASTEWLDHLVSTCSMDASKSTWFDD